MTSAAGGRRVRRRTLAAALLLLGCPAAEPLAASEEQEVDASTNLQMFGRQVLGLPDVDGDGAPEIVVAAHGPGTSGTGSVIAYSARDGRKIWSARGGAEGESGLGVTMCRLGDADGDSIPDVAAVCSARRGEPGGEYEIQLLSGKDGRCIRVFRPEDPHSWIPYGGLIAGVGDLDGDGADDLAARSTLIQEDGPPVGGVLVFSGRTAKVLRRIRAPEGTTHLYAGALCGTADWDGRGRPDVAVGAPQFGQEQGAVFVCAGEDGKVIRILEGGDGHHGFGSALLPGLDADGRQIAGVISLTRQFDDRSGWPPATLFRLSSAPEPELLGTLPVTPYDLAGAPVRLRGPGMATAIVVAGTKFVEGADDSESRVYALGGRDARPLWFADCHAPDGAEFGAALAAMPDLDGDGVEEVIVGAPGHQPDARPESALRGRVYLLSGRTGFLLNALGPDGFEPVPRDDLTRFLPDVRTRDGTLRDPAIPNAAALRLPDVAPLIPMLEKGDEERVLAVSAILQCVGRHAGPAVPAIRARLAALLAARKDSTNLSWSDHLISSLAETLASDELRAWIPDADLVEVAKSLPTASQQTPILWALARRGVPVASVLPWLRQHLDDSEVSTREAAWMGLGEFPPSDGEAGDEVRRRALAALLSDPESNVRHLARNLLHAWSVDASLGLEPLMTLLQKWPPRDPASENLFERWEWREFGLVLGLAASLTGDLDPAFRTLMDLSRSTDPILRARAATALAAVRFQEWRHVEKVIGRIEEMRTDDPDPMVREAAESAAGNIDARGEAK